MAFDVQLRDNGTGSFDVALVPPVVVKSATIAASAHATIDAEAIRVRAATIDAAAHGELDLEGAEIHVREAVIDARAGATLEVEGARVRSATIDAAAGLTLEVTAGEVVGDLIGSMEEFEGAFLGSIEEFDGAWHGSLTEGGGSDTMGNYQRLEVDVGESKTWTLTLERNGVRPDLTGAEIEFKVNVREGMANPALIALSVETDEIEILETLGQARISLAADATLPGTGKPTPGNFRFEVRLVLPSGEVKYPLRGDFVVKPTVWAPPVVP